MTRILIADDDDLLCEGVNRTLSCREDFEVVGTASDGIEALKAVGRLNPDIVILDIAMPRMNGITAMMHLARTHPHVKILILNSFNDEFILRYARKYAKGIVLKRNASKNLVNAIDAIRNGKTWLPPECPPEVDLSLREREILQLVIEGNASKEIACLLGLSTKTVETHRATISRKLRVSNVKELITFAIRHGLYIDEYMILQRADAGLAR